ncbi:MULTISPECIES: EAL domain-containing protein [unclassified Janthinobacterium]|uniref:EAL and HDOD domain-containing protein n=1 Tax=unclassified Janthinobacterium TaxID=2610881 RepID=UPI0017DCF35F|nr:MULTISPECIES: EAL domain-containing protein [unclassified Janthinobacterium]MBB5607064.1 EAL and modified HD-GYP domain-containing signal transduction protein [Janthinobacterium sp. S3T4]MBB5612790.1 EAL and modified HD-GYP domain-containing signal transduction protein [Janthinobacterium sp. S3M3]
MNMITPLPSAASAASSASSPHDFFLARQPILNREQRLVAYELLFRSTGQQQTAVVSDDVEATATVIAHAAELGMEQVVGLQLAFINVDAVALMSDFIRFLPHHRVVLEILETVRVTPELLARISQLRQAGFRFALDDVVGESSDVQQLLPLIDVIKVDIAQLSPDALGGLVPTLALSRKKLLAEKVETVAQFEQCLALGFDFFQGYYFARPVILTGKKMSPSELTILRLLEMVQSDADHRDIERCIQHDAIISLNLLRLVNTPAVSAGARIDTLGQALMLLGRRQLQRWLQILLYVKPGSGAPFASPLLQLATTRGKQLELMTEKLRPGQHQYADIGFTVGIMSLMDALFSMQMSEVVSSVRVHGRVSDALLFRHGELGHMLALVEQVEQADDGPATRAMLDELHLSQDDLNTIQVSAYEWVNSYVQDISLHASH